MRLMLRMTGVLIAVLATALVGAVVMRASIADHLATRALRDAGVQNPSLEITSLSLRQLEVSDLRAGADARSPDFAIEHLRLEYDLADLLGARRIRRLEVGPGTVIIDLTDDGALSIAGAKIPNTEDEGDGPAGVVDAVFIEALSLSVRNDNGEITGLLDGAFEDSAGGAFDFSGGAEAFQHNGVAITDATYQSGVRLQRDGAVSLNGRFVGDIEVPSGALNALDIAFVGDGASWREIASAGPSAFRGTAELEIASSEFALSDAPVLANFSAEEARLLSSAPVTLLNATGGVSLTVEDDRVVVRSAADEALQITSDRGDALLVAGVDGAPLFEFAGDVARARIAASLTGPSITGGATFFAETQADGGVRFSASSDIINPSIATASMGATTMASDGVFRDGLLDGDIVIATTMRSADIGRFRITDAPFRAAMELQADFNASVLSISTADDDCIALSKASFSLDDQKMTANVNDASLCELDGPLLTADWSGEPEARLNGRLAAASGRYRWGETRLSGAPPWIDIDAVYRPADHLTNVSGAFGAGRAILNDVLIGSKAAGAYQAVLTADTLSGSALVGSIEIAQAAELAQVAPIIASGSARLANNVFVFDYDVATPNGVRLGAGEAEHAVLTGAGSGSFQSGALTFAPNGLQPDAILPVLKGFIGAARGGASVSSNVAWGAAPGDFQSSAVVTLDDLTFLGPGVAVSQTAGLTGEINLESLAPVTSAGVQSIRVGSVDIGALVLENGDVAFELPGDETLQVVKAEFPWFGGKIGAYESQASLSGERATTVLRAEKVDLAQMLAYLEIEGLSGEGIVEGVLPLVVEEGRASIENGEMFAVGPGAVRYQGAATEAAGGASEGANIAFEILENLQFEKLRAQIDGPLDGDLQFRIEFEGANKIPVDDPRVKEDVIAPVIFRITLEAPLLSLIQNARQSTDARILLDRAGDLSIEGERVEPQ